MPVKISKTERIQQIEMEVSVTVPGTWEEQDEQDLEMRLAKELLTVKCPEGTQHVTVSETSVARTFDQATGMWGATYRVVFIL